MTAEHLSRGYAPLPQSISNTDTEDDDDHHENTHLNQRIPENTEMTASNPLKNGRFYPLDESQNVANRLLHVRNNLNYCNDEIPIMIIDKDARNDLWKRQDMSAMRRFCLIISILVCVFTILIFLYALPCDDSVICPETVEPQSSFSWDKTLEGIELHGPINVVSGTPNNLIFLLRGQHYGSDNSKVTNQELIPSDGGGVLSMQGNSGITLWWVKLKRVPKDINCIILDTNGSGKPYCLVSGEKGLLNSIEPTSGYVHWSSSLYTYEKLPVLLPDIDNDRIGDLLSVELDGQKRNLVILSGATGKLLVRQKTECQSITLQPLDSNMTVSYVCHDANERQSTELISLQKLITNVVNTSLDAPQYKLSVNSQINSYKYMLSHSIPKDNWELSPYYQLYVQNQGKCPSESCRVSVNLTMRNAYNESHSIWDHVRLKSFATKPAILNTTGQPYTIGFAIKFWQSNDVNIYPLDDNIVQRTWTEQVLLIYMNLTKVRKIKASQSEVVQLCRNNDCQPNFELQSHSIAIADLNNDGLLDLINYRTSYNLNQSNTLFSKVQIVKLDSFL